MKKQLNCFVCLVICLFAFNPLLSPAQSGFITLSAKTVDDLTSGQLKNYHLVERKQFLKEIYIVTTDNIPDVEISNLIEILLPFEDCPSLTFAASNVDKIDDDNWSWNGITAVYNSKDSIEADGSVYLNKTNGFILGTIFLNNRTFELYDLGEGLQVIAEADFSADEGRELCARPSLGEEVQIVQPPTPAGCENVKTKILVLYTPLALSQIVNGIDGVWNIAYQAMNQINLNFSNSGINNSVSIVKVEEYGIQEGYGSTLITEVDDLSNSPYVQSLRDAYKAEIVIILYADTYVNGGVSKTIGGLKKDAYCIVTHDYAINLRNFAHEVGHIFGGRHYDDPDPGTAHGEIFTPAYCLGCTPKSTLMSYIMNGSTGKVDYISNPNVSYLGTETGTASYRNNAGKMNSMKNYVAAFYQDPALPFTVDINMTMNMCSPFGTATASAKCGRAPYRYKWYTIDYPNGTWTYIGAGISAGTYVQPTFGYGSRPYKLVVTDAWGIQRQVVRFARYHCPWRNGGFSTIASKDGVNSIAVITDYNIFPNPANASLHIEINAANEDNVIIELFDISGKKIDELYKGIIEQGRSEKILDISIFSKGMYFLKINGLYIHKTEKFVI